MFLGNVKKFVLAALVAGFVWSMTAPQADAFWHHRRWGSSGGSSCSGCYGYYGGCSSCSSCSGCWGGYYYGGGCSSCSSCSSCSGGGWYSCGGCWGSSGCSGGCSGGGYTTVRDVPAGAAPVAPQGTTEAPNLDQAPVPGSTDAPPQTNNNSGSAAILSVHVPADAKVYVNGMLTRSTGSDRRFVSNGLRPGYNYTYELRAMTERNGQMVEDRKVVQLQAGQSADVNFPLQGQDQADERTAVKPVKTSLKLHVPADAKVFLSGNESKSTGETREFVTTKLGEGQTWDNYTVRVELERNGQKISKVERISLNAGESRELTIDVDAAQVAKANSGTDIQ